MPYQTRFSHLALGLFAGIVIASSASVSARTGTADYPTMIDNTTIDIQAPALSTLEVELPEIAASLASGPLGAVSAAEFECMAKVIDHEAGNQPRAGQLAVAYVMINRVLSEKFPNSLCGVAYQPRQFSYIHSHRIREGSQRWDNAQAIAREALSGQSQDTSAGALFFHARYIAPNSFFRTRTRVAALQDHIFYR